ncbi:FliA/WhiG family RNA polymerase sigma factor [Pandoraea apista]|nr:FliA/WhiG family RNA polymerase sigma factor [Pandoraea apista]RRW98068.1 FliA/WhiG family RNA polymerase sigma factor [Pandoraea apista]
MSLAAESAWLAEYASIVKRASYQLRSLARASIGIDDIEQIGLMGLLGALRCYGIPDAGFAGYATTRVRGAILDELRRDDWRPRTVRQGTHDLRDRERELSRSLGREPTDAELCEALGIDATEFRERAMASNAEVMASFDCLLDREEIACEENLEGEVVRRRSLEQALSHLTEREQRVIQLYYQFDLSLREIAAVLELSEARACQINKAALEKMRVVLSDA